MIFILVMIKQFIKLCLASILSLSLNAGLQAQELTPTVQATQDAAVTEDIASKAKNFVQEAQRAYPHVGVAFSEQDGKIFLWNPNFNTALSILDTDRFLEFLSNQDWLDAVQILSLRNFPHDAGTLLNVLSKTSQLKTLSLTEMELTADYFETLTPTLAEMPSLQFLNLSYTNLGIAGRNTLTALVNMLSAIPNLQTLDLFRNHLRDLTPLVPAFATMTHLNELRLGDNDLWEMPPSGWQALISLPSFLANLQDLDLRYNEFETMQSDCFGKFVEFVSSMPNLRSLDLWGNSLGAKFESLAPAIAQMSNLNELYLTQNNLNEMSADGWRALISAQSNIRYLNLTCCNLGSMQEDSFMAFAEFLSSLTNLNELNLSENDLEPISLDDWHALMEALSLTTNLQTLSLDETWVAGSSLNACIAALFQTTSIAGIPNRMSYDNRDASESSEEPHALEILLYRNNMEQDEIAKLQQAIADYNPNIKLSL